MHLFQLHQRRAGAAAVVASAALAVSVLAPVPSALAASSPTTSATTTLTLASTKISGLPSSVAPGYHTFAIKESAKQLAKDPRGLSVFQLAKGYTRADFGRDTALCCNGPWGAKAKAAYQRVIKNVTGLGGVDVDPSGPVTGSKFTVLLKPGTYILDNTASEEGARDTFTVLNVKGTAVGAKPTTVGTITSHEFAFKVAGAKAGLHTYALHDAGAQPHMYVIERVDKGHTLAEVKQALMNGGNGPPPSWVRNGGFAGILTGGQTMYTTLNLNTHTQYLLLCFMPDLKTGTPHFILGMTRLFSVK